jgi:hypothetical protein
MRADLERLLRDITLTTLAFAIALGWALFQVAEAVGYLIAAALQTTEGPRPGLSFSIGRHIFVFQPLVQALVEFAVVLVVVLLARRRVGSTLGP